VETLRAAHESWNKRDFAGDFQGDVTVQYLVVSAIDNPHSSFANLRHNAAMTENLTNHKVLLAAMLGCTSDLRQ